MLCQRPAIPRLVVSQRLSGSVDQGLALRRDGAAKDQASVETSDAVAQADRYDDLPLADEAPLGLAGVLQALVRGGDAVPRDLQIERGIVTQTKGTLKAAQHESHVQSV